jgi:hypothetical protein
MKQENKDFFGMLFCYFLSIQKLLKKKFTDLPSYRIPEFVAVVLLSHLPCGIINGKELNSTNV